ncbi:MAG: DUF3387 domain-containing protein [Clostridia bacterium]|jgi:type I restriction enzyme R subunit|nr:DUF3387 domain-containing protein [Clostridia bacterium]
MIENIRLGDIAEVQTGPFDDILKQIAKDLTQAIKNNMSIDWNLRESVRAKMRITIKRLLKKYGYPPNKQPQAIETVMKQAELMCSEEVS